MSIGGRGQRDWLTVVEAAAWLGVSTDTVRRGVADGSIPSYRPQPGSIRILRGELERMAVARSRRRRQTRAERMQE